jgi:hypothetical protein
MDAPPQPEWLINLQNLFIDFFEEAGQSFEASTLGIRAFLDDPQNHEDSPSIAGFAADQADKQFPFLRSQYAVAMWSSLDHFINSFLHGWLSNHEPAGAVSEVEKIRVPLSVFRKLDNYDQIAFLLRQLESATASTKYGIERFEVLLKVFGLEGDLPGDIKTVLNMHCMARNLIVHRCGIVDSKFLQNCRSWRGATAGDVLSVSTKMLELFQKTLICYCLIVAKRASTILGTDFIDPQTQILDFDQLFVDLDNSF